MTDPRRAFLDAARQVHEQLLMQEPTWAMDMARGVAVLERDPVALQAAFRTHVHAVLERAATSRTKGDVESIAAAIVDHTPADEVAASLLTLRLIDRALANRRLRHRVWAALRSTVARVQSEFTKLKAA